MSIENNQRRTIDGLNTLFCDTINVVESIELNGDNGAPNQLIRSDGVRSVWANISDLLLNLSVSSPLQFTSGTTYNGEVARTIEIPNFSIDNSKLISSTISGVGLGGVLSQLTLSNPLSFTTGTTYTGEAVRELGIADGAIGNAKLATIGNAKLEHSTISGVSLGGNLADLGLYYGLEFIDGSSGYNGSTTRAINTKFKSGGGISADANGLFLIDNTISGTALGSNLPLLTASGRLSFTIGAEYNGQHARNLQLDLFDLTAGDGLELDSGSTYNGDAAKTIKLSPLYQTISDRISYEDTGVGVERWLYTLTASEWRPNDDSSFYNIHIEDDSSTVLGRAKPSNSSLEAIAIIHIPFNWTAGKIFIDCRNNVGSNQTRTFYLYKIKNWGGNGNTYLGSYSTNSEASISYSTNTYGAGDSKHSLMIRVMLSSTLDHLGGGYITLTPPS